MKPIEGFCLKAIIFKEATIMKIINALLISSILSVGLVSCATVADTSPSTQAKTTSSQDEIYRVRLFFGLSLPTGGGVSLKQWESFLYNHLAKTFEGFNVVDSTGFYQGQPERSKVVTVIVKESEMSKVKSIASQYATMFNQDSVMMVKVKVDQWAFIGQANQ